MVEGCGKLVKLLMFIFNFIIFVSSAFDQFFTQFNSRVLIDWLTFISNFASKLFGIVGSFTVGRFGGSWFRNLDTCGQIVCRAVAGFDALCHVGRHFDCGWRYCRYYFIDWNHRYAHIVFVCSSNKFKSLSFPFHFLTLTFDLVNDNRCLQGNTLFADCVLCYSFDDLVGPDRCRSARFRISKSGGRKNAIRNAQFH